MPLLVADLVDPDADEAVEGVVGGPAVGHHPVDDRTDRPPGDPHQLTDRRLGGVGDQPGHLVVEEPGVPGSVAGPGHLGDGRAVLGTVHPRGVGLEEALHRPEIERPPVAPALALVIAGSTHPAAPTPALGRTPRPHVDHHGFGLLVEVDLLDHRRPVDTEHATPYVGTEHAILLALSSNLRTVRKRRRGLALLASAGQGAHGSVRRASFDEVCFPSLVSGNPGAVISSLGQMCGRQEIELLSNIANVQINHPIELGRRCLVPIDKAGQDGPASLTNEPTVSRLWRI